MKDLATPITGGCLCGAVRYEAREQPGDSAYCHCKMCQKWTGTPAIAGLVFPFAAVRVTRGAPKFYQSSPKVDRGFCGDCGSPLFMRYPETDEFCVTIGSLDDAGNAQPRRHAGIEGQLPWFVLADDLPRTRSDEEPGTPDYEAAMKRRKD
jgi:hypothetical protein